RHRILAMVGHGELDGLQAASLLNDLGYVERIDRNLRGLVLAEEPGSLRALRRLARAAAPAKGGHGASREVAENGNCSCSHPSSCAALGHTGRHSFPPEPRAMKGQPEVVDYLKFLLRGELAARDQYFLHSRRYEDLGLHALHARI